MGKVEKGIVLSVLALIVVILVISLTLDDPLKKEKAVMAGGSSAKTAAAELGGKASADGRAENKEKPPSSSPAATTAIPVSLAGDASKSAELAKQVAPAASGTPGGAAPSTLLNTSIAAPKDDAPAVAPISNPQTPVAASLPAGAMLKSSDGLQDSYLADMKFYTWQSGDSFRSIAAKYYGDPAKFTVLRRSNEGRDNVQPGEKILVPVFDFDGPHAPEASPTAATPAKPTAKAADSTNAAGGPRVHVVKDGESLWKIAKLELGDGGRWNEIYEANRDVLSKPEAVHAGLKLRIPVK
jgi:nucleoid-associated protein YgaU